jgi:hypothetical protein
MALPIILAYCALLLLVTLALLLSHWPRWLKGLLVAAVTLLYFAGNEAVHALAGVPSNDALPERFVMLAAVVDEPTQKSAGALYLWISPIDADKPTIQPRAYKLAYKRSLHEQISDGLKKGREGVSQMGTAEVKGGNGRAGGWLKPGNDEQEVKIRDLPVPQLPEK